MLGGVFVDPIEQAVLLQVGVGQKVGEGARELCSWSDDPHQLADDRDAGCDERVDVERSVFRASDEL